MSEIGPEARSILDGGRDGDEPSAADRARIRASVMAAIAAGGATSAASAGAAAVAKPASALSFGWKALGVIALVGAGAGVAASRSGPPRAPVIAAQTAVAASPMAAPPAASAPEAPASTGAAPAPEATGAPSAEPIATKPAPSARRVASAAPIATSHEKPEITPPAAPAEDTLPAETRRLREAHGAMQGGDPARAMALLDEQSAVGPELRQERAAARVLALCQLGKVDEARAAAAQFLKDNPQSPVADRVRASCAGR